MPGPTVRTTDDEHDDLAEAFLGSTTEPPTAGVTEDLNDTETFVAVWKALRALTELPEHLNRLRPHLDPQRHADALLDVDCEDLIGRTAKTADALLSRVL